MRLRELAEIVGGRIEGNPEIDIAGACDLKNAGAGDITFIADKKNLANACGTKASAVVVREAIRGIPASMLIVDNPRLAFAMILEALYGKKYKPIGISKDAVIGGNVKFGDAVSVFPLAYISGNVTVGNRVTISPGVYIGDNVSIGDNSVIYPNVTLRENVKIGKNVIIHPGAVIGADGFGFVQDKGRHHKVPQVGGVQIEDDVEIGANVTIDRATIGYTIIGKGTKVDNLVQIAHNVRVGSNCLIVAQVGIAGSTELGNNVVLGGQAGIADNRKIGDNVMVGAQSGVGANLTQGVYSGSPAIPHKEWLRAQNIYNMLPEMLKRLRELERKIKLLESKSRHSDES